MLLKWQVPYYINNSLQLVTIVSQINLVYAHQSSIFMIHFNIMFQYI